MTNNVHPSVRLLTTLTVGAFCVIACGMSGCGFGSAGIPPVGVNVDRVTRQLLDEFDRQSTGQISLEALADSPAIAECLQGFDANRDGHVSAEELRKNLARIFEARTGMVGAICVVRRNGQPLAGAEVRFVPVSFLEDAIPLATGTTKSDGAALMTHPEDLLPANAPKVPGVMRPGLYLVEVTHNSVNIPAKYNEATVLGQEVSRRSALRGDIVIELEM